MKSVYPGCEVVKIGDGVCHVKHRDGAHFFMQANHLPEGTKVGDKVTVTTETKIEKVERWP